jgi:hypothetical protein
MASSDSSGCRNLAEFPIEILLNISNSSNLTTVEYGNLRRTCKTIERKLFHYFALEFFTTRQIFIFPPSIQSLVDISGHSELSKYVKTVIIGTDVVSQHINTVIINNDVVAQPVVSFPASNALCPSTPVFPPSLLAEMAFMVFWYTCDFFLTKPRPRSQLRPIFAYTCQI